MSDEEWTAVRSLLPVPAWLEGRGGQPESYCHRQMLDAIRYLVAGGISWRSMPVGFPAWARVYAFFRRWRKNELIAEFHDRLREDLRKREGREAQPSGGDHRCAVGEGGCFGARCFTWLRRRQAGQRP
ncbi:transposase [Streptomyces sp. NPDC055085]